MDWRHQETVKIYVVEGSVGQYEGHTTWMVRAFRCKERAEEFKRAAQEKIDELLERFDWSWQLGEALTDGVVTNKFDSNKYFPDDNVRYYIATVNLDEELPQLIIEAEK